MTTYTVIRPYRRPDGKLLNHHGRVRVHRITPKKSGYGALYNWYAVAESENHDGFITGFHVPTNAECTTLEGYIQSQINASVLPDVGIGNILKSCRQVNSPLGGDCATTVHPRFDEHATEYGRDSVKFSALPGGNRTSIGAFLTIGTTSVWYSATEQDATQAHYWYVLSSDSGLYTLYITKKTGRAVRCLRTAVLTPTESALADGTIIDIVQDFNGNYYQVVKIGTQAWLAQNIRCINYADGTAIPNVTNNTDWGNLTTHAYCWYNNDINTAGIIYTDEQIEL